MKWWYQKIRYGVNDSEMWSLDITIAKFILPKLKTFRNSTCGYPGNITQKKWEQKLDDMIFAMEYTINQFKQEYTEEDFKRIKKGFQAFGDYFNDLWI